MIDLDTTKHRLDDENFEQNNYIIIVAALFPLSSFRSMSLLPKPLASTLRGKFYVYALFSALPQVHPSGEVFVPKHDTEYETANDAEQSYQEKSRGFSVSAS